MPLGAHWDGGGVNFSLFSAHAEKVELCIFTGNKTVFFSMPCCADGIWHGYLKDAKPGLCYAYRVYGPKLPGNRFNENILLLDPYAREITGVFSYEPSSDSAHGLRCRVVDESFDWQGDRRPAVPLKDTILYEIHVKGATRLHPDIAPELRGTYAGLATPPMIKHFKQLGITAVNLLPVHGFIDERHLLPHGLTNYWGYNTFAFFAPEVRYAARQNGQSAIAEFRTMVRTLHEANIEVILDVVYNHTAETDEHGPTLSFKGIDNAYYYRLLANNPALYENFSGCGNTLNLANPRVLQLVMDSLRYWAGEMRVDGFRFDLAAALTRDSAFLDAILQDPLLSDVKMIAEPWDLGPDGYRLGRFYPGWSEWNDRFRDDVRAFWLTRESGSGALAQRMSGSSEIFRTTGRSPQASINFITAHDGFTLRDLVSYQNKHNEKNGEWNRDGHNHNLSWNCGAEGESANSRIIQLRQRLVRALLATLFFSQGIPMLQGGDELGRTQAGNNNAYCQDNKTTWINWENRDLLLADFVAQLIALRKRFSQFTQHSWLSGKTVDDAHKDVTWWSKEGREMDGPDWQRCQGTLGFMLAPCATIPAVLVLINRNESDCLFRLPVGNWELVLDTSNDSLTDVPKKFKSVVPSYSLQLLVRNV